MKLTGGQPLDFTMRKSLNHALLYLFLVGNFAAICCGKFHREIIDVCCKQDGQITHRGYQYKTWLIISKNCSEHGTLVFMYAHISSNLWRRIYNTSKRNWYTGSSPELQISGIPPPLWRKDAIRNRTLNARLLPTVLTFYPLEVKWYRFKIRYVFRKNGELNSRKQKYETPNAQATTFNPIDDVNAASATTTIFCDDPKHQAANSQSSAQTDSTLAITFGVFLAIIIIVLVVALLRLRKLKNELSERSGKAGGGIDDIYATIGDHNISPANQQESRANELYNL